MIKNKCPSNTSGSRSGDPADCGVAGGLTSLALLATTAVIFSLTACQPTPHAAVDQTRIDSATSGFPVSQHVRRLVVWHPHTWEQDVAYGYNRLEQAAFELKKQRSWIKIVDRRNIELLTEEQRL